MGRRKGLKEENVYTNYYTESGATTYYMAEDGAKVDATNDKHALVHRFGVKGSCVNIYIKKRNPRIPVTVPAL